MHETGNSPHDGHDCDDDPKQDGIFVGVTSKVASAKQVLYVQANAIVSPVTGKVCDIYSSLKNRANSTVLYARRITTTGSIAVRSRFDRSVGIAKCARAKVFETYGSFKSKGPKVFIQDSACGAFDESRELVRSTKNLLAERLAWAAMRARGTSSQIKSSTQDSLLAAQATALAYAKVGKEKTSEFGTKALEVAQDGKFQATAGSAVAGAAALGTSGAATGLVAGGVLGAAVGVIPAIFTFGLSIPIGAMIGSGAGLATGATIGTTVGAIGGGAAGCAVYEKKDDIAVGVEGATTVVRNKVSAATESARLNATKTSQFMGEIATNSTEFVLAKAAVAKESAGNVKKRLVGKTQ